MSTKFIQTEIRLNSYLLFLSICLFLTVAIGCGTKAKDNPKAEKTKSEKVDSKSTRNTKLVKSKNVPTKVGMIEIKQNSPADTVKVFYERLRKKQFRDAFLLTNLRPAVEGLTDEELKELGVDFGVLAQQVPLNMPINGEIITGKKATVTVKMPNDETKKIEVQEIKLRQEGDNWVV